MCMTVHVDVDVDAAAVWMYGCYSVLCSNVLSLCSALWVLVVSLFFPVHKCTPHWSCGLLMCNKPMVLLLLVCSVYVLLNEYPMNNE